MSLREPNSELHWASTRPEDNTPATAVAVGHFVQVVSALSGVPRAEILALRKRIRAAALSIGAT
jgi:hypothetical protein